MCGIAGIAGREVSGEGPALLQRMSGLIRHRGPDDQGALGWTGTGPVQLADEPRELAPARVLLAHRRLSILDLSAAGRQPMVTADGRHAIVFNGEIYNYRELRTELEGLGCAFRTRTDTEVLLQAFVRWGAAALNRLVGMFAFAVLDTRARTLFLARDFFGIKPLYYAPWAGGAAFASEVKPLLELPGVGRAAHPGRVYEYLSSGGSDHGPHTFFADVLQLPAGHYLEVDLDRPGELRPVQYWRLQAGAPARLSFAEAAEELRARFLDSVRLHLRSDVPVGAALSGGIDSSSIVMAMRALEPALELHTFSYVADDARVSEERWVDVVHAAAGTAAHKAQPGAGEMVAELDALIRVQEEPFGSTSNYAQNRVFRLAREAGIKVMLDGQGADELLGGYWPFLIARFGSLVYGGRFLRSARFLAQAARLPHVPARALMTGAAGVLVPAHLRSWARGAVKHRQDVAPDWLRSGWFRDRGADAAPSMPPPGRAMLRSHLRHSVETGLAALLRFEDRNSMAYSIESRVPFLTPQLAEFIFSLPEEYVVRGDGTSKAVFRQSMRGLVPDAILDRRDKIGFATPERDWLGAMRPWVEGVLRSDAAFRVPAVDREAMVSEWNAVLRGDRYFDPRVWRWINLIRWSEVFEVRYE
jgi:asparagine synthase (glutamine-hydrolysing)